MFHKGIEIRSAHSRISLAEISARKKAPENSMWPFQGKNPLKMGNYTIF